MDGIFKLLTSPTIVLRRMGGTSVPGQHWSCFPQRIKPKSLRQVLMPVEDIGMLCHKQSHPLMKEFCPFQLKGPLMLKSIALFQFTNSLICSGAGVGLSIDFIVGNILWNFLFFCVCCLMLFWNRKCGLQYITTVPVLNVSLGTDGIAHCKQPCILVYSHGDTEKFQQTRCLQSIERLPMLLSPPALTSHVARRIKCSPWSFYLFSSMFPRSFSPLSVFQSKCHLSFFYREWIACHSLPSYSAILWLWCWEGVDRRVIYWIILFYNNF